jgi:hypothetical protein
VTTAMARLQRFDKSARGLADMRNARTATLFFGCTAIALGLGACAPTAGLLHPSLTVALASQDSPPPPPAELFLPTNGRADAPIQVAELEAYARMAALKAQTGRPAPMAVAALSRPRDAAAPTPPERPVRRPSIAMAGNGRHLRAAKAAQPTAQGDKVHLAVASGRKLAPLRVGRPGTGGAAHAAVIQSKGVGGRPNLLMRAASLWRLWSRQGGRLFLNAVSHV